MGIRKGWALCGAREERCFISHAVSSHPLLELQTLGLSTLSSPHHQDLPLDSIQKTPSTPQNPFPPPPRSFFSFAFFSSSSFFFCLSCYFTCHMSPPSWSLSEGGNSLVANFIHHFFTFPEDEWKKPDPILETFVVREHTSVLLPFSFFFASSSFFFFFRSPALPPDRLSLDIIPDSAHANDMGGGCVWIHCPLLLLPLLPPPLRLLFPGWSRNGLASWSTLRNHGHGVSLGKQRPGQEGFTQTLIILRAISGGSPQLYAWLELPSLIAQNPLWLENELILSATVCEAVWALKVTAVKEAIFGSHKHCLDRCFISKAWKSI